MNRCTGPRDTTEIGYTVENGVKHHTINQSKTPAAFPHNHRRNDRQRLEQR